MQRLLLLLIALFSLSCAEAGPDGCVGSTEAKVAVFGEGGNAGSPTIGYSYLVKTTYPDEHACVYILPPYGTADASGRYPYRMGYKDSNDQWVKLDGKIKTEGSKIIDNDPEYGDTVTTVLYTHLGGGCDVTLFEGQKGQSKVQGPFLELWYHSGASEESMRCCEEEFRKNLKEGTAVRKVNKNCDYGDVA
uniref:Lipocalin n=1 Tax=Ornithodoros kalahariensis TaxID=1580572 RepID=Q8I9U2_ORNKA|nr:lipocalin [Ornithodoros kalahariensis]